MDFYDDLITAINQTQLVGGDLILSLITEKKHEENPSFIHPYYVSVSLTNTCNCRCLFCSADSGCSQKPKVSINEVECAIKKMLDEYNPLVFSISGGEPMLYPDDCLQLVNLCDKNTGIALLTNLSYPLSHKCLEIIKEMDKHPYSLLQTSVDTLNPEMLEYLRKGSNLKLIQSNINYIRQNYPHLPLKINTTVSEMNYHEIYDIMEFCSKLNVKFFHANFVIPKGRAKRATTIYDLFNVLNGLRTVVEFRTHFVNFSEITFSVPIEVRLIQSLFKVSFLSPSSEQIHCLRPEQYVCSIDLEDKTCSAGWDGRKFISFEHEDLIDAFYKSAESYSTHRDKCFNCDFNEACSLNNSFFDFCLVKKIKEDIETLFANADSPSNKERKRNAILDMVYSETKYSYLDVAITKNCNGHCNFCQVKGGKRDSGVSFIADDLKTFIGEQSIIATITGGEPLLKKELLIDVIKCIKSNKRSVITLLTNLSLLTDDLLDVLKDYYGYYDVVQVSVYSSDPEKHHLICGRDDWKTLNNNIRRVAESGVPIRANLTLTKDNIHELEATFLHYISLGVEHININCLLDLGFAEGMVDVEYLLSFLFEVSSFVSKGYSNYGVAIPIELVRCYHRCIEIMCKHDTPYPAQKIHEWNLERIPNKLHVNNSGDVCDVDTNRFFGNMKDIKMNEIQIFPERIDNDECRRCYAYHLCGGKTTFWNGKFISCCKRNNLLS